MGRVLVRTRVDRIWAPGGVRSEEDGGWTGKSCQHDRASDGERRVGRPRRIVPLAFSCARLASRKSSCSAMPAMRDVACHRRVGARE